MGKKRIGVIAIICVLLAALAMYPVDVYISSPGGAYELSPIVEVENGDRDDKGSFSLMTISLAKATALTYLASTFSDDKKLLPIERVRQVGEDDREYAIRQKNLMSNSQFNAITVAFEKAGIPVHIDFDGVIILTVLDGGAATGILEAGDKVREVDGKKLVESGQFFNAIAGKKVGDTVKMKIERDGKTSDVTIALKAIPTDPGRAGLGIRYAEDRTLTTDPEVIIHTEDIGGPSAGLMFTLEIMNQLLDEDLTKGYKIAGTGEMNPDGTVGRIGGADFKVIAAAREGIEIFFAPDDEIPEEVKAKNPHLKPNYEEALESAKKIGTSMKIVPVKTIDDALKYLEKLEPK